MFVVPVEAGGLSNGDLSRLVSLFKLVPDSGPRTMRFTAAFH